MRHQYQINTATPGGLTVADLNADGRADVVSANASAATVSVLLGNGDGTLRYNFNSSNFAAGGNVPSVAVGDCTRDGIPDLVTTRSTAQGYGRPVVLPGRGDGTFAAPIQSQGVLFETEWSAADLNGDGQLDLITASWTYDHGAWLNVYWSRGDGTFRTPQVSEQIGIPLIEATAMTVGDFNEDGRPDVVVAGYDDIDGALVLLSNNYNWPIKTWIGPASGGDWSNPINWSPAGAPAASDHVSIAAGKSVNLGGSVTVASLTLTGGATLTVSQHGSRALRTGGLTIGAGAKLDLKDNDLIVDYTGASPIGAWNGLSYGGVTGLIARGYADGEWSGDGLVTTASQAQVGVTTLAVAEASQLFELAGTQTATFGGQTVDATAVIVKYTYSGDVNFDGGIDGADYGVIDNWVQFPGTSGYVNGDFNYDGVIDGADYGLVDNAIQLQGAAL